MKVVATEIDKAISAHSQWKVTLKEAIHNGKLDKPVETVRANNKCGFGQWLYGPGMTAQDRLSKHFVTVAELHTEFHKAAAAVAELALAGQKAEAEKLMGITGQFAAVSAKLTTALVEWKKASTPVPTHS